MALRKVPYLHLELIDIAECVETLAIYYKSVNNKRAIEIMFFNEEGKINKVYVHYNLWRGGSLFTKILADGEQIGECEALLRTLNSIPLTISTNNSHLFITIRDIDL